MTRRAVTLSALLDGAGVRTSAGRAQDPEIRGVQLDSRLIRAGDLFVALAGHETHGLRFLPEALARGAVAVVAEEPAPADVAPSVVWLRVAEPRRAAALLAREYHGRPDEKLALVGITGTNGKTTVAFMVEAIAAAAGRQTGRIGTVTHSIGAEPELATRTTPEAPEFYDLVHRMFEASVEIAAVEVSSHALAQFRVEGARFAVGAFLNLGRDHLDFHGDVETYFEAKAKLITGLGEDAVAVLPDDSVQGLELARRTRARVLTFGRGPRADFRLRDEKCAPDGSSAVLDTPTGRLPLRTDLVGRFNLDNAACAAACAAALGLPGQSVTTGLLTLRRVPGRVERIDCGQPFSVLVDYAHTPEALESLLIALREVTAAQLHVVFGCGGERDHGKRPLMGRVAAERADSIVVTSDNPRREPPETILDQIHAGIAEVADGERRSQRIADRRLAIGAAIAAAREGDTVVIAGKGHEETVSIGGEQRAFDDRAVARQALATLGWQGIRRG